MARCGIRLSYPVKITYVDDGGGAKGLRAIGDAETLGEAIALANSSGFQVRDNNDGGECRLADDPTNGTLYFLVTVYAP